MALGRLALSRSALDSIMVQASQAHRMQKLQQLYAHTKTIRQLEKARAESRLRKEEWNEAIFCFVPQESSAIDPSKGEGFRLVVSSQLKKIV